MICRDCHDELPALLAGELSPARDAEVRSHLAACRSCSLEWERVREVGARLDEVPAAPAPEDLESVLLAALAARRPARARWMPRIAAAAALFLLGALTGAALVRWQPPGASDLDPVAHRAELLAAIELARLQQTATPAATDRLALLTDNVLRSAGRPDRLSDAVTRLREARRERDLGNARRAAQLCRVALADAATTPLAGIVRFELAELLLNQLGQPDAAHRLYDRLVADPAMQPIADRLALGRARCLLAGGRRWAALSELDRTARQFPRSRVAPHAAELAAGLCYDELRDYDAALARYSLIVRSASAWGLPVDRRDDAARRLAVLRSSAAAGYAPLELKRRFDAASGGPAVTLAQELITSYPTSPLARQATDRLGRLVTEGRAMSAEDALRWHKLPLDAALSAWRLDRAATLCGGLTGQVLDLELAALLERHPALRAEAMRRYEKVEKESQVEGLRRDAARGRNRLGAVASLPD